MDSPPSCRTMDGVAAIVPAAGAGTRLGGAVRKPFVQLDGMPLLAFTLKALQASAMVRWIVLVVHRGDRGKVAALITRYQITKACPPRLGGASRAASVANGFAAIPADAQWVLIHDGARPCVSPRLIDDAARAAMQHGAVACGLPASLTVKEADGHGAVVATLNRDRLWFVQTPQVFRRDWFTAALTHTNGSLAKFPDDAAMVESAGFTVRMIPGDPLNLKVTTRADLLLAEAILAQRRIHTVARWRGGPVAGRTRSPGHLVTRLP